MYAKIIVPLDGSAVAEGILPYARTFAKACKAPIEILHVITPEVLDVLSDPAHHRYSDEVEADMRRRAFQYLRPLAASLPVPTAVECVVRVGEPAEVIVDEAKPGTLVTMATHGRSGVHRWLLGSVAEKVLNSVRTHLLLAHTGPRKNARGAVLKSIVVPLDGSELAEKILPAVVTTAKLLDAEVILIGAYALPNAFYTTDEFSPELWNIRDRLKAETTSYLERKVESLKAQGLNNVSVVLAEGDAAAEIVDLARKTPENLVAMSTHGKSGIRRLLGSITDRVVQHSFDPVLIVPPTLALGVAPNKNVDSPSGVHAHPL